MPFTQSIAHASATFNGNYNDIGRDHNQADFRTYVNHHHHGLTIHVHAGMASAASLQHTITNGVASALCIPSAFNELLAQTQSCHQKAMVAADDASGLIVSIIQILTGRTEVCASDRDTKKPFKLLNDTLVMIRLALQTFEYTPLGRNLAINVKPHIIGCRDNLQEFSNRLNDYREGLSFTGVRDFWSRVLWNGNEAQELSLIKEKLSTHHAALKEFLVALKSISWEDVGSGLCTGAISTQQFRTFLDHGPLCLQHILLSQIIVKDHLGSNIPIPTMFCTTWEDFSYILNGRCKGRAGVKYVTAGKFELIRSDDSKTVAHSELAKAAQPGMFFEMSIVLKQEQDLERNQKKCPRCRYINGVSSQNGWIECKKCSGMFKVDGYSIFKDGAEEHNSEGDDTWENLTAKKSTLSPISQSVGDSEDVDEILLFRRIQVVCIETSLQVTSQHPTTLGTTEHVGSTSPQPPVKKKRKRANAAQLKVLNETFQRTALPSTEERQALATELDLAPRSIQLWFQSKRASAKYYDLQSSSQSIAAATSSSS